jgi:prepilin-type N-terminal cleavage/methylation domain-containing protein
MSDSGARDSEYASDRRPAKCSRENRSPSRSRDRAFTLIELLIVVAIIAVLACIAVPNFLEAQVRAKVAVARTELDTLGGALDAYWLDQRAYPPNLLGMRIVRPPVEGGTPDPGIVWSHRLELAGGAWLCETSGSATLRGANWGRLIEYDVPLAYNGVGLIRLTTPVAYIGVLPRDGFLRRSYRDMPPQYRTPTLWVPANAATTTAWNLADLCPYGYLNLTEFDPDGLSMPAFGRTVTYVLTSGGPDIHAASFTHISAAFPALYDPTNGTVSQGDLVLAGPQ